jgi:uncharacterized membrane protein
MHKGTVVRVNNELLLINLCSLVLILIISFADIEGLRIALGLPFLLFFPGYTFIATLFPGKSDIGATERTILSITLSVILTPFVAFVLNFVWVIELYPILVSLSLFIAVMSAAAWYRRRGVAPEDRLSVALSLPLHGDGRHNALDRVVSVVLAVVFLGAIVTVGYVVANPKEGEQFTEFYMLGAESQPAELAVGDEAIVALGIRNHEQETMSYTLEVTVGGSLLKTTDPIELNHGQKWEDEVKFFPNDVCADTALIQDVSPTDNSTQVEVKTVRVASTDHLQAGDKIWIGQESAVVQGVDGYTVTLSEGLKQSHIAGTGVTEVQKVEFRLIKIRKLGEGGETSLSLWVGKDHLSTRVLNQGQSKAAYQLTVIIGGVQQEEEKTVDPMFQLAAGGQWTYKTDFEFSENHVVEFLLYKDGELVYRRLESGSYPSLYTWIHVSAGNVGG